MLDWDSATAAKVPLPQELVRFRTFAAPYASGEDEPEVLDHLRGRLRFTDITTLNDPFEARPAYIAAHADVAVQREAMLSYLAGIAPGGGSMMARRRWARERIAGKGQQELIDLITARDDTRDKRGEIYVFCLMASDVVSTPLPWSHYADSHRGVCLHFDPSVLPIKLAFQVDYDDEYPTVKVPRTAQTDWTGVRNTLLRKSRFWSYEKEFRLLRIREEHTAASHLFVRWDGDVGFAAPDACRAITLGCRMLPEVRDRLLKWIAEHTPRVQVWQARLHRSRYELVRERI